MPDIEPEGRRFAEKVGTPKVGPEAIIHKASPERDPEKLDTVRRRPFAQTKRNRTRLILCENIISYLRSGAFSTATIGSVRMPTKRTCWSHAPRNYRIKITIATKCNVKFHVGKGAICSHSKSE